MSTTGQRVTRILMTCGIDEGVGGVQVVFRDLIHWLERSGRQVHLVYPAPLPQVRSVEKNNWWGRLACYCPMPAIVRNSAWLTLPVFLAYLPITFFHLARLMRSKRIDVVNCHYLDPCFVHLVIAGRLLGVPIVLSVHGADIDEYRDIDWLHRFVYRTILRGAHRIVACSEALARQTIDLFPELRQKVTYVHNGLDLSHYEEVPQPRTFPQPFVLCVSRHVRKKGVDTLLHAFAEVVRDAPSLSLVLVGNGPLIEEHERLARTLGIERQVMFMGKVDHADVSAFFAACTLFVLPSRAEPFGVVVLEAGYYRKGIVSTRVGGVPEILTDGINARLVEPDNPGRMAAQITALLRNPELADRLGAQARETLMSRFLWKDRVNDYIEIYEGGRGPSPLQLSPESARVEPDSGGRSSRPFTPDALMQKNRVSHDLH
jgi:glycosyltransferase involved in cell wall biosynthesis